MTRTRTIGTILIAAIIGLVTVLLSAPKKSKGTQGAKKEQNNLFI